MKRGERSEISGSTLVPCCRIDATSVIGREEGARCSLPEVAR